MLVAGAPNLHRAVAECTQPYCSPSPAAARALQKYLCDDRCMDLVYLAVLARASAQPISEAVIAKCAALIKQNLHRHTPSRGVLLAVQAAAHRLAASLQPASDVGKSLLFLSASAARLEGGGAPSAAQPPPRPSDTKGPTPSEDAPIAAADSWRSRGTAVGDSFSAASSDATAAAAAACGRDSGLRGSRRGLSGEVDDWEDEELLEQELQELGAVRPVLGQGDAPPPWALAPEDLPWPRLLAAAADGFIGAAPWRAEEAVDWADLVPEYSRSLAPLLQGVYDEQGGALPALDSSQVLASFSDVDPDVALTQMLDIVAVRRDELKSGPDHLMDATEPPSISRAMFHQTPYTQQEPLTGLASGDIAAVLEVMVGRAGGAVAPSAISGRWEEELPERHWQVPPPAEPPQQQQSGGGAGTGAAPRESFGQVCACVLSKMVIDTWLGAGSKAAAPLVLRMLQHALHHSHPTVRARPFDILYNLSIHAALLSGIEDSGPDSPPSLMLPTHAGLSPPSAPPERSDQLYARPPSPNGAQRTRGGSSLPVSQLPSPRIHLPPQVMQRQGPASSGSGGSSPRSAYGPGGVPTNGSGPVAPQQSPQQQQQQYGLSSPRSRLGRGDALGPDSPGSSSRAASPAAGEGRRRCWEASSGSSIALEVEFEGWLRQLLFELLCMLAQLDERSEQVWQSAVGCLLHLTTHAGYWVRDAVTGLPPQALRGLLCACLAFDWAHELHTRFAQLVPLVLCTSQAGGKGGRAGGVAGEGAAASDTQPSGTGADDTAAAPVVAVTLPVAPGPESAVGGEGQQATAALQKGGKLFGCSGVDPGCLAEFGGPGELMLQFCHASSPEALCCLLLPLLDSCMPPGTTPAAAARAALALGDSPARLNALQSALRSARPGLADPIMTALGSVPQLSNPDDLQLISSLVLGLEEVATQLGVPHNSSGSCGGEGAMVADRGGSLGSSVSGVPALEAALSGAVDVTLQQAAGSLAEQQAQSAAGAWRALRELCWCGEPAARAAASSWLQRLLGVSLEQGGEDEQFLPLPPGTQPPLPQAGAFADALAHIVGHCPSGPDLLLDALQLHINTARGWPAGLDGSPGADDGSDANAAAADMRAAHSAVRAWGLVLQWLSHAAPRGAARGALTRLAGIAASLLCWPPPSGADCWSSATEDAGTSASLLSAREAGDAVAAAAGEDHGARGMVGSPEGGERAEDSGLDHGDEGAPESVCHPQGFLVGQRLLSQEAIATLGPESLAALIGRLLLSRKASTAASRGFTTRVELGPIPTVLAPASDTASDLQLSLLLSVITACSSGADSYAEAGLEALARQVLSFGMDVRQCFYLSVFVLEHLMLHHQGRYWQALKQLLAKAQHREDERLLGNPFLQLQALFGAD